jgi:hypothetical protein
MPLDDPVVRNRHRDRPPPTSAPERLVYPYVAESAPPLIASLTSTIVVDNVFECIPQVSFRIDNTAHGTRHAGP